jgi:outer membrane protein OmpA-like peptidoglycan-associated protein
MKESNMSLIKQLIFLAFLLISVMIACVYTYFNENEINNVTEVINNPTSETNITTTENNNKIEEKIIPTDSLPIEEKVEEKIEEKEIIKEESKEKVVLPQAIIPQEQKIEELSKMIQPKKIQNIKTQEEIDAILSKQKIFFKRLGTDITDESYKVLEDIAKILSKDENIKIEIGGHTDSKGEEEVNEWISLQRAKSVKKELVKLGISEDRITAIGYGESKPLVPNDKNGYSFENRRVEFKIIEE